MASAIGSSSYLDRNLQKEMRAYRRAELVLQFGNMLVFGLSLVLIVVGLLYLTVYYYEYSFSTYSVNLVAGFYITLGVILFCIALMSIFALKPDGQPMTVAGYILALVVAFIILIVLGSVGLGMKASNELLAETQLQMQSIMREYDNRNLYKYHTKKIDWLQKRFTCCGVNSYLDWRTLFYNGMYGGPGVVASNPTFVNQFDYSNKNPYGNTLPDSCCVNVSPGCGRQLEQTQSGIGIHPHGQRTNYYYTAGCASIYYKYFSYDVAFLGALSITISLLLLLCMMILGYGYMLTKDVSSFVDGASSSSSSPRQHQAANIRPIYRPTSAESATNSTGGKKVTLEDDNEETKSFVKPSSNNSNNYNNNHQRPIIDDSRPPKVYTSNINDTLNNASNRTTQSSTTSVTVQHQATKPAYYVNDHDNNKQQQQQVGGNKNFSRQPNVGSYYTSGLNYYK